VKSNFPALHRITQAQENLCNCKAIQKTLGGVAEQRVDPKKKRKGKFFDSRVERETKEKSGLRERRYSE
jgi:hypothetical protein